MRIAVYTIAKNESKHVDRWVKATEGADLRVVVDTGSEDDTYERLLQYPVEAHRANLSQFRFDEARNIALDLIPSDFDVCVSIDMDEIPDPDFFDKIREQWKPGTTRAWAMWDTGSIWSNNNRIHARQGYRWKYPCHEVITSDKPESFVKIDSCVRHKPDDNKSRGQYLDLLELGHTENPTDARMLVYLVREYYFKGMWDKIIEYGLRIDDIKDVWDVELAQTYRFIGDAYYTLGDLNSAEKFYVKATDVASKELESWFSLAFFYYKTKQWAKCAGAADKVNYLKPGSHYIAKDSSVWSMYDLLSLSYWNIGIYSESLKYAKLAYNANDKDERLASNLRFIEEETEKRYGL